ncbi:MAG: hypothetical protein AB7N65_11320 [Vicinamibacterales bacterium]
MRGGVLIACALAVVWVRAPLLAQEHEPSKPHGVPHGAAPMSATAPAKSATHATPASQKPDTKSASHEPEGAAHPAAEYEASDSPAPPTRTPTPSNAATSTSSHADDEAVRGVERKAWPPRPAAGRELDAVMERINRRISSLSTEGGKRAVASTQAPAAAPASGGRSSPAATVREVRATNGRPTAAATFVAASTTEATTPPRVRLSWRPTVVWPASLQADPTDGPVRLSWETMVD